ncbi:peptidylprolyl isomerase [Isoptericola jiangsuensis]|uniref:peptidylprolyl isomerase n=1 Tax=Isoptericola jiangsuensis TaxID=548579 RepID=A0A2A9EXY2_9MICO|nr:FKBP-type peptidyl-prolyl cis-trans isomerase [Isoptericola jiangsuensis]PFG43085.1 peptidylprolyl isomerase [Isoptericola jiangsuensis]
MLPTSRLRQAVAASAVAAVLLTAGCSSSVWSDVTPSAPPSQVPVEVLGAQGAPPELEYPQPYAVSRAGSRTLLPGTGAVLEDGGPVLLDMYAEDGRDGSVISSTFTDAPSWYSMDPEALGQNLYDSLRGKRVGARVLLVEEDEGVPVVLVVDVLPTAATGETVEVPDGLPDVLQEPDGSPRVLVPDGDPPQDLVVQPVVRGNGGQVSVGQVVTARYVAVRWSDGTVVDSSWGEGVPPQSATIGIGQLVEAWDQGLLEQSVGSRVMLVAPPYLAHGGTNSELAEETMVYVVDILDARYQVTEELPPDEREGDGGTGDEASGGQQPAGTTEEG